MRAVLHSVTLVSLLATGAVGCGGDDESQSIPVENLPLLLAEAICASSSACWGGTISPACVQYQAILLRNGRYSGLIESVKSGAIEYDQVAAGSCVMAVRARECAQRMPAVCGDALHGNAKQGEECAHDLECGEGRCAFDKSCPGTCAPGLKMGKSCTESESCAEGLFCAREGREWSCMPEAGPGDACGSGPARCAPGLVCLEGACRLARDLARSRGPGEECLGTGLLCQPGLACGYTDATLEKSECISNARRDEACSLLASGQCEPGTYCGVDDPSGIISGNYNGTCRQLAESGGVCDPGVPIDACPGLERCDKRSKMCTPPADLAGECVRSRDCLSRRCLEGKCVAPHTCDGVPLMPAPTDGITSIPVADPTPFPAPSPAVAACETSSTACSMGMAGEHACGEVDLLAELPPDMLQGAEGNDVWGWTDTATGKEYALVALDTGTSFVDLSDPCRPVFLGHLPARGASSKWRDIKVSGDHAFVVSEAAGHGLQVFDLAKLTGGLTPPERFTETAHLDSFGSARNLVSNPDSSFVYPVGTDNCQGARIVDVSKPKTPKDMGCFAPNDYIPDMTCVKYRGPHKTYKDKEVCVAAHEERGIKIYDVSDKSKVETLSKGKYENVGYAHQAWLTDDHRYLLLGDESDENRHGFNTRTYLWDVSDLEQPKYVGVYEGPHKSTDHNLYVRGKYAFMANYTSGLSIVDITKLKQVASFDTYPKDNSPALTGAWSVYPFFGSGIVIVNGSEGLHILRPYLDTAAPPTTATPEAQL